MTDGSTDRSFTRSLFRILCLLTAVANAGGNVAILLFHRPIFRWFGVPVPRDMFSFAFVCGFSFTVGILAWMVFREPERNTNLLVIGIIGKTIYAFFTFYFYHEQDLHWFYRIFGIWDAIFAAIFFLFLIHLLSPDLTELNSGAILPGSSGERTKKALLLYYSLTNNGRNAIQRVKAGLIVKGYTVDEVAVQAQESLFHFPFSLGEFIQIMVRAIFRVPAKIKPLGIPANHPYDLIVVECQTWFIGMGAPMEGVFQDPANRAIFAGRDVAVVNVCRGLWRRPQAMTVRWVKECGGRVVGVRAYANPGIEPIRTFSLFIFLGAGKPGSPTWLRGVLTQQHLSEDDMNALERFGEALAQRPGPLPLHQTDADRQVA